MRTEPAIDPDGPDLPHGAELEAIADAILDGLPIDWGMSPDDSHAALIRQLRVIADLSGLHRTFHDGDSHVAATLSTPCVVGAKWGTLTVLERLGRGAFGEVFRAWDYRLEREVALKLLFADTEPSAHPEASIREGRLLARVRHPNVVSVYGAERIDGRVGIWTEFVHGKTLADLVREQGRFTAEHATSIGLDLCRALGAVHTAGLIHGDVKAHNVMLEKGGRIALMDFGAGGEHGRGTSANAGDVAGTPLYLAPELWDGAAATPQSDIYSLGVLLFHLVTGSFPVRAPSTAALRAAHEQDQRSRLRDVRRDLPKRFTAVVDRALDPEPLHRFESAAAMEAALVPSRRDVRWTAGGIVAVTALAVCVWTLSDVSAPQESMGTATRKITLSDDADGIGGLSADARLLGFSTLTGQVSVLDTRTGTARAVVEPSGTARALGGVLFRPGDGSMVFGWRDTSCECARLREVGMNGGDARTVLPDMVFDTVEPLGFSRDGARLLVGAIPENRQHELAIVDMATATYKPLLPYPLNTQNAALSPDGRFIAYDRSSETTELAGDIFVTSVNSGETHTLTTGPADETVPMWTPDGRAVLFVSDATGTRGLWQVEVKDGRATGDPELLQRDMGLFSPLSVSAGGTLLFWRSPILDVETAEFDSVKGMVSGEPRKLPARFVGSNSFPDWSPDGSAIVYASERKAAGPVRSRIVIHDVDARSERELAVPINGPLEPRWSPDGRSLLVRGPGARDGVRGARSIDATTGTVTRVFPYPGLCCLLWSRDGLHFYFAGDAGIHRVDARTGERVPIPIADGWRAGQMALSPDGTLIAAAAAAGERRALLLIPAAGGRPRILYVKQDKPLPIIWDWTPDGSRLLGVRRVPGETLGSMELVTVSVADGTIAGAGLRRDGLTRVTVRPDGRALAYGAGLNLRTLWVLERFLPVRSAK